MKRVLPSLAACACAVVFVGVQGAQAAPDVSVARIECGTPQAPTAVNPRFSDTFSYGDLKLQFVYSCYLIKHDDQYLLWDTGHAMTAPNVAPKVSIVDQLSQINVKPEQITYVGISHYHADHTGQVGSFPKATLLIGKGDWDAITAPKPAEGVNFKPFENWISGGGNVQPVPIDKDVFGDGSVVILSTPGHTPGHQSLQVKLPKTGEIVLSGDAVHFKGNWENRGVPVNNFSKEQTLASMERLSGVLSKDKAQLWINHDKAQRDTQKMAPECYE
jgi:N-acyl homoserine lactone hydrolase